MIQFNEYMHGIAEVDKLGFPSSNPSYIPESYLTNNEFLIFRTCHSYGDWVILSSMPRLLKQKYPDCIVAVPSPKCINKFFNPKQWTNKHENPFNNIVEVFAHNPYVDGFIDDIPSNYPIYHDHFRIFDSTNPNIPLVKQMLKYWRFDESEMQNCEPELYWSDEERSIGDAIIKNIFEDRPFGFLYIDDTFLYEINRPITEIQYKRNLIQAEIDKHDLTWLYFSGNESFIYNTENKIFNVKDIDMSLRVQNYVKSKSKLIIGYQGGYGTDCMSRYTDCYVVPLNFNDLNEHIQERTIYLN